MSAMGLRVMTVVGLGTKFDCVSHSLKTQLSSSPRGDPRFDDALSSSSSWSTCFLAECLSS